MSVDLTQGYLLPRIDQIMSMLQQVCPPYKFPADGDRSAVLDNRGWRRGGTSPSGQNFGDISDCNWFVGDTYLKSTIGAPWRLVWLPPLVGEERFVVGKNVGMHAYAEEVGGSDAYAALNGQGIGQVYRLILHRISPVRVDIWGSDYPDLDLLVHWLASCTFATNAGAAESCGVPTVDNGGLVPLESGVRGLRYQLKLNFVFPIISPIKSPGGGADAVQGNSVEIV